MANYCKLKLVFVLANTENTRRNSVVILLSKYHNYDAKLTLFQYKHSGPDHALHFLAKFPLKSMRVKPQQGAQPNTENIIYFNVFMEMGTFLSVNKIMCIF